MPNVRLPREILKQFLPNHQAIRAFEQVLDQISGALPTTIEEANNNAGIAIAAANAALSAFNDLAREVMMLANAPLPMSAIMDDDVAPSFAVTPEYSDIVVRYEPMGQDDVAPRAELGTIAAQNSDFVDITGGAINSTPIGATTASTVSATTLTASGTVTLSPSNVNVTVSPTGTGTATFNPATTGTIDNMIIGATTPRAGTFTTVNGLTITTSTGTLTIATGKTFTVSNTMTLAGTDGRTYTFPTTNATIARTDAAQTFTGDQRYNNNIGVHNPAQAAVSIFVVSLGTTNATRALALLDSGGNDMFNVYDDKTARFYGAVTVPGGAPFLITSSALPNGAGAGAGTIANAPAAGNPTKWIPINDNGTTRYIPAW